MFKLNKGLLRRWLTIISSTLILLLIFDLTYYGYAPFGGCSDVGRGQRFSIAKKNFLLDNFPVLKKEMISEMVYFRCSKWVDFSFEAKVKVPAEHGNNILKHAEDLYQIMKESDNKNDFYREHGSYNSLEEDRLSQEIRQIQNSLFTEIRNNGDKISTFNEGNQLDKIIARYRSSNQNKATVAKADKFKKKLNEYAQLISNSQKFDQIKFSLPHTHYHAQTMEFLISLDNSNEDWVVAFGIYSSEFQVYRPTSDEHYRYTINVKPSLANSSSMVTWSLHNNGIVKTES